MQIVIPMAGQGSRFLKNGYSLPKPLIKVDGKPMIEHVTDLFSGNNEFLYICNRQHLEKTKMKKLLSRLQPSAVMAPIAYKKKGPVYGIMQAEKMVHDDSPIIVNYCDFNMTWSYDAFCNFVLSEKLDGAIVCYKGFHPHLLGPNYYASVLTDKKNNFLEIKEKHSFTPNKMDSWQSCGTYYFKSGKIMKKYFDELMKKKMTCNGEYYVSMVYNLMHQDGLKIKVYPIEQFCQWGTPEDLAEYLYWSKYFSHLKKNRHAGGVQHL